MGIQETNRIIGETIKINWTYIYKLDLIIPNSDS